MFQRLGAEFIYTRYNQPIIEHEAKQEFNTVMVLKTLINCFFQLEPADVYLDGTISKEDAGVPKIMVKIALMMKSALES